MAEVTSKLDTIVIPEEGNSLYKALQMISQVTGISFKYPTIFPKTPEEVCNTSSVRSRKVALKRQWWHENKGPLLVFFRDTSEPVVLIYTLDRQYELFDPATRQHIPITRETLNKISPVAYTFYAPLPEGEYSFSKLLSWGFRGQLSEVLALITAGFFAVLLAFFFPIATKILFDVIIPNYNVSLLKQVTMWLVLSALGVAIFQFARSYLTLRIIGILQHRLQVSLWDRLLKLPLSFFRQFSSGDTVQRTFIFDQLRRVLSEGTLRIILNGVFSALFLMIMFLFSWKLALIALAFSLLATILTSIFLKLNVPTETKIFNASASINSFLTEIINGLTKIRISFAEWNIFSLWSRDYDQYVRLCLKSRALKNRSLVINTFLENTATVLIFGAVIWMITNQSQVQHSDHIKAISIGTFMGFFTAYFLFNQAVFDALNTLANCVSLIPFWERTRPIFTTKPEISSEKVDPGILKGEIHVENLTFHYPSNGAIILDEINFEIKPGEIIGITGQSGVGKSTLCRLLIAFEKPTEGSIFYDNKDLSNIDPQQLRKQMGIILQNSSIFTGTIFDNIVFGGHFSTQQIENALKWSTLDQDISKLPMGLDTIMPSGGGILSKGQQQRLLLARAFIREPRILILDEAMHALDSSSLQTVFNHVKELKITRIIVTQRPELLKLVDRTLHLENGKLKT